MRITPSDILFLTMAAFLLLLTSFTLGGLAACPF
jgi:lipoprotein